MQMPLANSIPWKLHSSGDILWGLSFDSTFQFERVELETLLWIEGFLRFLRLLTVDVSRDITEAVNFIAENTRQAIAVPVPIGAVLAQKAGFLLALLFMALEMVIVWHLFNPLELFIVNPNQAVRPDIDRVGLLRRF